MHRPMFGANSRHVCSKLCLNFPVQTCSSLCGAIAIVFIAVVANCPQEDWQYVFTTPPSQKIMAKLVLYQQPSEYAPYIRKVLAGWILTKIDINNIVNRSIFDMLPRPRNQDSRDSQLEEKADATY